MAARPHAPGETRTARSTARADGFAGVGSEPRPLHRGAHGPIVRACTPSARLPDLHGAVPPDGYASNAEFVKSKTNGPTAKSFNINFASLYGPLGEARVRPSNLWCGDEAARDVVERLNRDAGYDPVYTGPIENAAAQEALLRVIFAISEAMGPYVYRFAPLERL